MNLSKELVVVIFFCILSCSAVGLSLGVCFGDVNNKKDQFGENIVVLKRGVSLKNQIVTNNTTYLIYHSFDLKGDTVSIPPGSKLVIIRGLLYGGTIIGNDTKISAKKKIFLGESLQIGGSWKIDSVYDEWFEGDDFKEVITKMLSLGSVLHFSKNYTGQVINTSIMINHSVDIDFHGHTLEVKSRNLGNNRGGSCWIFNSDYLSDAKDNRNIKIKNLNIVSSADNHVTKDGMLYGKYSGLNLFLCRDLDTVRFENVYTKNIDYCIRVGGDYNTKKKNIDLFTINNCHFDSSIMSVFIKNTDMVIITNSYLDNGNQNNPLLHCIYAFEGINDMKVDGCVFSNSLSAVNLGTTDLPSNPINKVRLTNCVFNCATTGCGSVGSWYPNFSDDLIFENCIINNQAHSLNGNASFKKCLFTGTVSYHYHFINGAKFYDCVFNIKLGVDHQYGIVSGLLNNCEFTVDCNNHSIYYWVDSHSERQATSIKHTKFDFTNTHGDLFLLGCENDYSKIEIDDVEVSYSNDAWEKPITIRLLGRSKAIDTKGEIYINGLYLNGSTLDYYVNARYANMKVLNCKNIYSNGMKQEDLYYDNTKN